MYWDANLYKQKFKFVSDYGASVLDWVQAVDSKQASAIDLACGQGELTRQLADEGFQVLGIDTSDEQLAVARSTSQSYMRDGRIIFKQADMADFSVARPVDLVFSNAAFHWMSREQNKAMLQCSAQALKVGGQLVFEMGGYGNNAKIHEALSQAFQKRRLPYHSGFYFPKISDYASLIEASGLLLVQAQLFPRDTLLQGEDGLSDWIRYFVSYPFQEARVSREEQEVIIQEAVTELREELYQSDGWHADYVRLRMRAVKEK